MKTSGQKVIIFASDARSAGMLIFHHTCVNVLGLNPDLEMTIDSLL